MGRNDGYPSALVDPRASVRSAPSSRNPHMRHTPPDSDSSSDGGMSMRSGRSGMAALSPRGGDPPPYGLHQKGEIVETKILSGRNKKRWVLCRVLQVKTATHTGRTFYDLEVLNPQKWKVYKTAIDVPDK